MKKVIFSVMALSLLTSILFVSCSNDDVVEQQDSEPVVEMAKYTEAVYANRHLLSDWAFNVDESDLSRSEEVHTLPYQQLKCNLLPVSMEFAEELDLNKADIEEIFGTQFSSQEELEDALIGILLMATMTDECKVDDPLSRGKSFFECLGEAAGIYEAVDIITNLAKGCMSKSAIKALVRVSFKVCGRTCNGIGLALFAAEVAWCMW